MTAYHDKPKKPGGVREPVQVYLAADDQLRLSWLTAELSSTKSDVLRQGLAALERQLADPAKHPALGVLSLGDTRSAHAPAYDVAREHDRFLAESEEASWTPAPRPRRGR